MPNNEKGFSFLWQIENFSMLPHQLGEMLSSPTFEVDAFPEVEFSLRLYPRGRDIEGYITLFLCKMPEQTNLKINFNLAVQSAEPSEEVLRMVKDHALQRNWGYPRFMSVDEIYAKTKHYLPQDTLTIRCEISPSVKTLTERDVIQDSKFPSMLLRKHNVSSTSIQVQKRSIMWVIRNVKERIQQPEKDYILLASFLENTPSLKLTFTFNKISNVDYFPITINQTCLSSQVERLFVKCKLTVTSSRAAFQVSKTSSHLFTLSISDVWSFPPFITISMLTDEKYVNADDKLILLCEFAFSYKDSVHHLEKNNLPCTFEARQQNSELCTGFEDIYGSGKFFDIELKAGGRTFPYYKVVLCARSSVFRAMFENDMQEKNSNLVEIEDVDPDTLQRLLTYMHSDVMQEDLSADDVCKLYIVSNKYDLASLKKRCSALLATIVTLWNVCDLLVLADAHLDSLLMTAVSDFICSHATEVFHSAQWKSFMEDNPKLSCNVMHKMGVGINQI